MAEVEGNGIAERLRKVQSELKVPKDLNNSFGGYKYRSAESILEAVKPLLNKNELTLTISDELLYIGERYYVRAVATLRFNDDTLSVSALARETETKKGMDESQITGSTSSYARKYALSGMFAIDDTKDADHDSYSKLNTTPTRTMKKQEPEERKAPIHSEDEIRTLAKSLGYSDKVIEAKLATVNNEVQAKVMVRKLEKLITDKLKEEKLANA